MALPLGYALVVAVHAGLLLAGPGGTVSASRALRHGRRGRLVLWLGTSVCTVLGATEFLEYFGEIVWLEVPPVWLS